MIRANALECLHLLNSSLGAFQGQCLIYAQEQLERFHLWADNIGVFAADTKASLDYRLRDAPDVAGIFTGVLRVLHLHIGRAAAISSTSQEQVPPSNLDEPKETPDYSIRQMDELRLVAESIGRLQRVSLAVRQSSKPQVLSKAANFVIHDTDEFYQDGITNSKKYPVDFEAFIRQFLASRLSSTSESLREHLTMTLTFRRRRFMYTREHQRKLQGVSANINRPVAKPMNEGPLRDARLAPANLAGAAPEQPRQYQRSILSATTASTFNTKSWQKRSELTPSVASSAISVNTVLLDRKADIPPPPDVKGKVDCECPYCLLVYPVKEFTSDRRWLRHFEHDLQPYSCIAEECLSTTKLFSTLKEWLQHVDEKHTHEWICPFRSDQDSHMHELAPPSFQSEDQLLAHLKQCRGPSLRDRQLQTLARRSKRRTRTFDEVFPSCPFCSSTLETLTESRKGSALDPITMQGHLGDHMLSVALVSLPPRDDLDNISGKSDDATGLMETDGSTRSEGSSGQSIRTRHLRDLVTEKVLPLARRNLSQWGTLPQDWFARAYHSVPNTILFLARWHRWNRWVDSSWENNALMEHKYMQEIKGKFENCARHHESCGLSFTTEAVSEGTNGHPYRLLDVKKLCLRTDLMSSASHYATLSYCWGSQGSQPLTRMANIREFKDSLSIESLPKTVRDAIMVCRMFDIPYLWVDRYCIIQDSREDWEDQVAILDQIFGDAVLNISADWGDNADSGLFSQISPSEKSFREALHSPLQSRAWIFQERLLSHRVLHFTNAGPMWECRTVALQDSFGPRRSLSLFRMKMGDEFLINWRELLLEYCSRSLTKITDRLPALRAITNILGRRTGVECYYGIWDYSPFEQLLWYGQASTPEVRRESGGVPSWSWAAVDGSINYFETRDMLKPGKDYSYSFSGTGDTLKIQSRLLRWFSLRQYGDQDILPAKLRASSEAPLGLETTRFFHFGSRSSDDETTGRPDQFLLLDDSQESFERGACLLLYNTSSSRSVQYGPFLFIHPVDGKGHIYRRIGVGMMYMSDLWPKTEEKEITLV